MATTGTLLVAGDTPNGLGDVTARLVAAGYQVRVASRGDQVFSSDHLTGVDMVVLDLSGLGPDGVDICRQLKAHEQAGSLPIVVVGPRVGTGWRLASLLAGAADIIEKPFHSEELLACVRLHLELARLHAALEAKSEQLRRASSVLRWDSSARPCAE